MRRRDHLAELYQSGRWRRYFTEQDFLALMRETVKSVENWAALAYPKGIPANDDGESAKPPADGQKAGRAA